jgi:hypothetical protein
MRRTTLSAVAAMVARSSSGTLNTVIPPPALARLTRAPGSCSTPTAPPVAGDGPAHGGVQDRPCQPIPAAGCGRAHLHPAYPGLGPVAGSLYDVFRSGCVSYSFDFKFGPHVALMEQFEAAVGLYPRQQLRLDLRKKLAWSSAL